jgi:hypothetical protein
MHVFARIVKSKDVAYALVAASYLASLKESLITIPIFLGGLYVGCFEHLLRYYYDYKRLLDFMTSACDLPAPDPKPKN